MSKVGKLLEAWNVYSPSEEQNSIAPVYRGEYDSKDIRNIMMSYFLGKDKQDVINLIREHIDKMPDEWVIEFLTHQEDTTVDEIK